MLSQSSLPTVPPPPVTADTPLPIANPTRLPLLLEDEYLK